MRINAYRNVPGYVLKGAARPNPNLFHVLCTSQKCGLQSEMQNVSQMYLKAATRPDKIYFSSVHAYVRVYTRIYAYIHDNMCIYAYPEIQSNHVAEAP